MIAGFGNQVMTIPVGGYGWQPRSPVMNAATMMSDDQFAPRRPETLLLR